MGTFRNLQVQILAALILSFAGYACAQTGLRIRTVSHTSGLPRFVDASDQTNTGYVQGPNSRFELPGFHSFGTEPEERTVIIQRCSDHVMYRLDLKSREYSELPLPAELPKETKEIKNRTEGPPNLAIETTVRDTGETKSAFGHTARHYITTTKQTASPELGIEPNETVEDAWYLDIPDPRTCGPRPHGRTGLVGVGGGVGIGRGGPGALEKIRPEFKHSGPDPQGLMLSSKRTNKAIQILQTGERQEQEFTTSTEIVEMSEERVDPALFEVPPGFKKVSQVSH
ncbi:MAG TPA: hypothetical protein VNX88_16385 [Terriglobales bacterium]|jgi:hypothetical protein|nr:hypothetical protein [Terriglobales bacterium]